jgi:hypothetical protein
MEHRARALGLVKCGSRVCRVRASLERHSRGGEAQAQFWRARIHQAKQEVMVEKSIPGSNAAQDQINVTAWYSVARCKIGEMSK